MCPVRSVTYVSGRSPKSIVHLSSASSLANLLLIPGTSACASPQSKDRGCSLLGFKYVREEAIQLNWDFAETDRFGGSVHSDLGMTSRHISRFALAAGTSVDKRGRPPMADLTVEVQLGRGTCAKMNGLVCV
jgi:hypothetical protein